MTSKMVYWLKGQPTQNFGDYLSEYFRAYLFYGEGLSAPNIRLIGSCIDDGLIEDQSSKDTADDAESRGGHQPKVIFWGCGLRRPDGLNEFNRRRVEILSVRGPLTRSALRLGSMVPIGDPGLLLPALYDPRPTASTRDASILVPHFNDQRNDEELLRITGSDLVLRPNIPNDLESIEQFIDQICAAKFVLSGSLHAAIAAVAYRKPFGFWESGNIDLPFKWLDFAASVSVPCDFFVDTASAQRHYESVLQPAIKLPVLWPLVNVAPYPVRVSALARVVRLDVEWNGIRVLDESASQSPERRLQEEQLRRAATYTQLRSDARELRAQNETLTNEIGAKNGLLKQNDAAIANLTVELRQAREQASELHDKHRAQEEQARQTAEELVREAKLVKQLSSKLDQRAEEVASLKAQLESRSNELASLRSSVQLYISQINDQDTQLNALRSNLGRMHVGLNAANLELEQLRSDVATQTGRISALEALCESQNAVGNDLRKTLDQIMASKSWRVTAPLRTVTLRYPKFSRNFQRLAKLVWWTLTFQLLSKLKTKLWVRSQIASLQRTELLDKAWYLDKCPEVAKSGADVAEHYFWFGAAGHLDPHPLFDTSWYLQQYPEVTESNLNPLVHYLRVGAAAGYSPHPLFDSSWYCEQHPEVELSGEDLLIHYLRDGARAEFDPNPWFDNDKYLIEHAEVATFPGPPLLHYVLVGSEKKLDPHPLFDSGWYCATYKDEMGDMDPLVHYLTAGIGLGCVPSLALENARLDGSGLPELSFPLCSDPDVTIVIPAYKHYFQTYRCLYSIMLNTGTKVKYEILVADDHPEHTVGKPLLEVPGLRVEMNPENLGFLRNCNHAAQLSSAKYIVFLNNDTVVGEGWLAPLVQIANADPSVAMVGGKLLNPDGTIQEAGGTMFEDGWGGPYGAGDRADRGRYNYVRQVDVVIGACFLVRRSHFDEVGHFDVSYAPAFYEEFDLAFAFQQKGYRIIYQSASEIVHFGSQSYGPTTRDALSLKNHNIFVAKWATRLSTRPNRQESLFIAREARGARRTILVIDDGLPAWDKQAGAFTIYQYLQLMIAMDFRVIFCGLSLELVQPYASVLQQLGIEIISKPETLGSWLAENGIHLDYVWSARPDVTGNLLDVISSYTNAKVLYYTHDLHYLRELRRYELDGDARALVESNRLRDIEFGIFRNVDCVMTPSCEEVRVIQESVPSANVREVLPYFYTPDPVSVDGDFSNRDEMIFVGGFGHPPNVDAALWLVREILPMVWERLPDARLIIVGSNPPESVTSLKSERVEVVGYVPDVDPYYQRARISVNPLRYGAGVKGKIVASLKAGVPVVTTPIGNEGIGLCDGVDGLIGESPQALAERIIALYQDDLLCSRLADAGRSLIRRRFSVMKARQTLCDILGVEACVVCGASTLMGASAKDHSWYARPGCESCGSSNLALMVASVVVEPFRKSGISTLRGVFDDMPSMKIMDSGLLPVLRTIPGRAEGTAWVRRMDCSGGSPSLARQLIEQNGILETSPRRVLEVTDDYELIIGEGWDDPESFTTEQLWNWAGGLKVGGRAVCTTVNIAEMESAWRLRSSRALAGGAADCDVGRLIIHEIAPEGLAPYVGVIEYCR